MLVGLWLGVRLARQSPRKAAVRRRRLVAFPMAGVWGIGRLGVSYGLLERRVPCTGEIIDKVDEIAVAETRRDEKDIGMHWPRCLL